MCNNYMLLKQSHITPRLHYCRKFLKSSQQPLHNSLYHFICWLLSVSVIWNLGIHLVLNMQNVKESLTRDYNHLRPVCIRLLTTTKSGSTDLWVYGPCVYGRYCRNTDSNYDSGWRMWHQSWGMAGRYNSALFISRLSAAQCHIIIELLHGHEGLFPMHRPTSYLFGPMAWQ